MQTGFIVKHTVFSRPSGRLFFSVAFFFVVCYNESDYKNSGSTPIIFGYNGRDGVVTDANGLLYMRARYYSPNLRRFVNSVYDLGRTKIGQLGGDLMNQCGLWNWLGDDFVIYA